MKCSQAKKYMSLYIDGELDEVNERELVEHINGCSSCSLFFDNMKQTDSSMKDIFDEKELPDGFSLNVIDSLPESKCRNQTRKVVFVKKYKVLAAAAAVVFALAVPLGIKSVLSRQHTPPTTNSGQTDSMVAAIRLNDIDYIASSDVITDERIIDKKIGTIKKNISDEHSNIKIENGVATMLPVGTVVYSIKGLDKNKAVAAKYNGDWMVYKARGQNILPPIYSDEYLNAEKIVVSYDIEGKPVQMEITNKDAIKAIAGYLKNVQPQDTMTAYANQEYYRFYFYVADSSGIGKVAPCFYLFFNDPNLGGFISYDKYYKVTPEIMKLLVPGSLPGGYDASLGGNYQIYDAYISPKVLIRRYIKDDNGPKPEVKVIGKDDKVWKNGRLTADDLKGIYKLEIIMRATTIQQKVIEKFKTDYKKIPGAVSVYITNGESNDTTVIYIGFDNNPKYTFDEYGESLMIFIE